jgi:hypothetical protein
MKTSRKISIECGNNTYKGKNPCPNCNTTTRYVKNRGCVQCHTHPKDREARILSSTKYRNSNKGKLHQAKRYESLWGRSSYLFLRAKKRAKEKGIPITITRQIIYDRLVALNGIGEVVPDLLDFSIRPDLKSKCNPYGPSVDQKIPGLGYTLENFQLL